MKKYVLLAAILLFGLGAYSQSWDLVNPRPSYTELYNLDFVNGHIGYAVGSYGTLLKTDDGGETWHKLHFYSDFMVSSIRFINQDTGWISTWQTEFGPRRFFYTTNGCQSFTLLSTFPNTYSVNDLYIISSAEILLSVNITNSIIKKIVKTSDGGNTWNTVLIADTGFNMKCLEMVSPSIGFITTASSDSSKIYKTNDGGNSWTHIYSTDLILHYFLPIDENNLLWSTDSSILRSDNGGISWSVVAANVSGYINPFSHNGDLIASLTNNNTIIRSKDFGHSWLEYPIVSTIPIHDIQVLDSNIFCALSDYDNLIARSQDSGVHWVGLKKGTIKTLYAASFINGNIGFAAGLNTLIKTTNAGEDWENVITPFNNIIADLAFTSNSRGFAINTSGKVLRTIDGGISWDTITIGDISFAKSFCFPQPDKGFLIGTLTDNGTTHYKIYRTANSGSTWIYSDTQLGTDKVIHSMCFIDPDKGFACYDTLGSIIKTIDGGSTWSLINSNIQLKFNKIFFVNENMGYALIDYRNIYKTIDGGHNWMLCTYQSMFSNCSFSNIYFKNENEGFLVGYYGIVFSTINAGLTWEMLILNGIGNAHPNFPGTSYFFKANEQDLFLMGSSGTIYKLCLSNLVKGKVFNDLNNNQLMEPSEPPVQNFLISATSGSFNSQTFAMTDSNGNYQIKCDSGGYTINIPYTNPYSTNYPVAYSGVFNGLDKTDTSRNFAIHFNSSSRDLEVYLASMPGLARRGFNISYQLTVRNIGTDTIGGNVRLTYDTILTYLNSSQTIDVQNGNTFAWNLHHLLPLETRNIIANFYVPANATLGDTIYSKVILYPIIGDSTPQNNRDSLAQRINGSYDPNSKEVSPAGPIMLDNVHDGQILIYTIHFQNYGNDTAFRVRLEDCISDNLDAGTIELLSSSSPCSWVIDNNRTLNFFLNSANLPPRDTNYNGSCGFVKYKVMMKKTLTTSDEVSNEANIFFDQNYPVSTNTVKTKIISPTVSVNEIIVKQYGNLLIYPNPTASSTNIEYNLNQPSNVNLSVYNFIGALVTTICNEQQPAGTYKKVFNTKEFGLSAGIYFVRLSVNGKSEVKKLVVVE